MCPQVYVWGRRNENVRLTFLNLFPFTAPYLPWVLLTFSVVLGNPATIDVSPPKNHILIKHNIDREGFDT